MRNPITTAVSSILKGVGSDSYNPQPRDTTAGAAGGQGSVSPEETVGERGSAGSAAFGGIVVGGEASPRLSGKQRFVTYSDMMANTSIVATAVRYYLNILTKAQWKVQPAQDKDGNELPGAAEVAERVEQAMGDMLTPWSSVIKRAAMYRFLGFSVQEWTAKRRDDGSIGYLDVAPRPQVTIERWAFGPNGNIDGCWQRTQVGGREVWLPRAKIIHMVDDALEDSPEGLGLFRHVVRAADRLRAYEELEEVGFETDLRGIPIARAPLKRLRDAEEKGNLTKAQIGRMLKPFDDFIRNHIRSRKSGLLTDSSTYSTLDDKGSPSNVYEWDMSLLQGSSSSQEAVAAAITRLNYEMARVLSCEHLLLGSDGSGSLALGTVKTTDFYQVVSSTLTELTDRFGDDFVDPLLALNGDDPALKPKLVTESVQYKDVAQISATLKDMATAGAVLEPDDPAIDEVRDLIGLSRRPQEQVDRALEDAAMANIPDLLPPGASVPPGGAAPGGRVPSQQDRGQGASGGAGGQR